MSWEARLEDARRRRAQALAARASVRDGGKAGTQRQGLPPQRGVAGDLYCETDLRLQPGAGGDDRSQAEPRAGAGTVSRLVPILAVALGGLVAAAVALSVVNRERAPTPLQSLTVAALRAPSPGGVAPVGDAAPPVQDIGLRLDLSGLAIESTYLRPQTGAAPVLSAEPAPPALPESLSLAAVPADESLAAAVSQADPGPSIAVALHPGDAEEAPVETVALEEPAPDEPATGDPGPGPGAEVTARIRVFVPDATGGETAESIVALAGQSGWQVAAVSEVDYRVTATHVRFYHEADRAQAERLAAAAGGEARDFTGASPLPPTGALELYVAGEGSGGPATRTATSPVLRFEASLLQAEAEIEASLADAEAEIVEMIEEIFD